MNYTCLINDKISDEKCWCFQCPVPWACRCPDHSSCAELQVTDLRPGAHLSTAPKCSELGLTLTKKIKHQQWNHCFISSDVTWPTLHILESRLLPSHPYLTAGERWKQPLLCAGISVMLQSVLGRSTRKTKQELVQILFLNMTLEELLRT